MILLLSVVDSVVLYPRGALVFESRQVKVVSDTTLVIDGLPGSLNPSTVRVKAGKGLRVVDVSVELSSLGQEPPRVKALRDSVKAYEEKINSLRDELDALAAQEEFLKSVKVASPELINRQLLAAQANPQAWQQALDFVGKGIVKLRARKRQIERSLPALQDTLRSLRERLSQLESRAGRASLRVSVSPVRAGRYKLRVSYAVEGSDIRWEPVYELRALPEVSQVEITMKAKVLQRTGVNWKGVKLILSTAAPRPRVEAPELEPWRVRLWEPVPLGAPKKGLVAAPAPKEMEALPREAEVQETGVSLRYSVRERVDLPSGEEKVVFVSSDQFPAQFSYYAYPRLAQEAFLQGSFVNNTDFHYLPGEATVYVGEEYTGRARLKDLAPGEADTLSFGPDPRVKITREPVKELRSKSGFIFKNKKRVELGYRITVENFLKRGITLRLWEAVPLPNTKEIAVKDVKITPKPNLQDDERKLFGWELKLKAFDKWQAEVRFAVEWPKDKKIVGLF